MKKVPRCNVQLVSSEEESSEESHNLAESSEQRAASRELKEAGQSVNFEEEDFGDDLNEEEVEEIGRRRTRSMTAVERDKTSTFWLKMENTECYDNIAVYVVEVPVAEHKKVVVVEAKEK